ncbi:arsenate reductase/protein-tyrosine-phosphatase family protein [Nakamurella alba]|uniref:arsenate reductase/protein-tyrosine-phosphatase family protein n=1 Tax=Nakamurella alba TaxID=2665158 RepID=UPI002AC324C3|nr:protein tyrosine phosphatase [Nakamurella alba]
MSGPVRVLPADRWPAHRARDPLRVIVVCSGNICRSPVGEQMLRTALGDAGLGPDVVQVTSAGTGNWHAGDDMNERSAAALDRAGITAAPHVAHEITIDEARAADLLLAADRGHVRALRALVGDATPIRLFREFDPAADDLEVPDPYYGPDSGFDDVVAMTAAALPGLVAEIRRMAGR